ncbi:MAG: cobalamin biosynthesis protein [Rhodospirillales bacterium]
MSLPEACLVLLSAIVLELLVGPPPRWLLAIVPTPAGLAERLAADADRRLNRPERGAGARRLRGVLVLVVLVGGAVALGALLDAALPNMPGVSLLTALLVVSALRAGRVRRTAAGVGEALRLGQGRAAREMVSAIGPRDGAGLDDHGVARGAVEAVAARFDRGIVAPGLLFLVFGFAGLFGWIMLDALAERTARGDPLHRDFGAATALVDAVVTAVPSTVAALLLAGASPFVPGARGGAALRVALRQAVSGPRPSVVLPVAATAGALDAALGGPWQRGEVVVRAPWIGEGRARLGVLDVRRAVALAMMAQAVAAGLVALVGAGVYLA